MTPQEEQLLQSLAERVNSTQLQEKDPDAEGFLNQSFSSNPDAVYILAQTVLVQNIALQQARTQVAQLQQQAQQARQPARATSFLGNLLGHHDAPPPPPQSAYPLQQQPAEPPFQPVQQNTQPPYPPQYQPAYPPPAQAQFVPMGGGPPSFLRGAVQTAAGVAAGALAFEGVEAALHGIMGHPGYGYQPGFGGGGFGMTPGFDRPVEETVVNNYYDQPGGHEGHEPGGQGFDQGNYDSGSGGEHFRDSADRSGDQDSNRDGAAQFSDASYDTQGGDQNQDQGGVEDTGFDQNDNAGFDDGGQQDSGGFDDGGGGFDGGGGNDLA